MNLRDAPPADRGAVYGHGSTAGHQLAAKLAANPGKWGMYRAFETRHRAQIAASRIRTGHYPAWRPVGVWETVAVTTGAGHEVWVRHMETT